MIFADGFMPTDLADRLHRFLCATPELIWETCHGTAPQYRYHRLLVTHARSCACAACTALDLLCSEPLCAQLATVLGVRGLRPGSLQITWYAPDDYLEVHTDSPNGDIAFVWSVTRDWRPEYGGNLHLFGAHEHVEVPAYNRLMLFEVTQGATPHCVSRVRQIGTSSRRLAVTGWYRC